MTNGHACLLLLTLVAAVAACAPKKKEGEKKTVAPKEKQVNVEIEVVAPKTISINRVFHGETIAMETRRVVADAFGKLTHVTYVEHGFVKKGQRLATVDGRRIGNQRVIQAQANLVAAQDLLRRVRALRKKDLATDQQLVDAKSRVKSAVAGLQIAKLQLQYNVIRAPIAGYVLQKHADAGSTVNVGTPIVTIVAIDEIKVRFWVPEMDLAQVRLKTPVTLEILAFPRGNPQREIKGQVHHVGFVANEKNRTFPVDVVVPNAEHVLRVGMLTRATITAQRYENAVLVDQDAIIDKAGKKLVFVAKDGKAQRREVETGVAHHGQLVVSKGLSPGEWLIVIGQRDLQPNDAVRVVNPPTSKAPTPSLTVSPPKTQPITTPAPVAPTSKPAVVIPPARLNGSQKK